MMKKYANIIFLQGWEAETALRILDEQGEDKLLEYLVQWDNGDSYLLGSEPAAGISDTVYIKDDYRLSYNARLGYVGLERVKEE